MTTSELRKIVTGSASPDWFNSVEIQMTFNHINHTERIKGFSGIHRFLNAQVEGWEKHKKLPREFNDTKNYFSGLRTDLQTFLTTYQNQESNQVIENNWRSIGNRLNATINHFTFDSIEAKFLMELYKKMPESFPSAYSFITGAYRMNNKAEFIGALQAYEFSLKDTSKFPTRRKQERDSINKIKNDLKNQATELENELSQHLIDAKKEFDSYVKQIDDLKEEKEQLFSEWYQGVKDDFHAFRETSGKEISDLESIYDKKLQLEKPAKY